GSGETDDGVVQAVGGGGVVDRGDAGARDVAAVARYVVAGHALLVFIGGDAVGVGHVAALYGRHVEAGDGVVADLGAVATGVDSAHVAVRHVGVQAGDRIADDVGAGEDSPSVGFAGRAACVVGRVAAHPAVVA